MLTKLYVEALLIDEDLADQVWALWDRRDIADDLAWIAWLLLATNVPRKLFMSMLCKRFFGR